MGDFTFLVWLTLDDGFTTARGYCTRLGAVRAYNSLRKGRPVSGFPTVRWREIGWREYTGALSDEIILKRARA